MDTNVLKPIPEELNDLSDMARTIRAASSVKTKRYRYKNMSCTTKGRGTPNLARAMQTALKPVVAINIKAAVTVSRNRVRIEKKESHPPETLIDPI